LQIERVKGGVTFQVLVSPRASRERVGPVHGDRLKLAVKAPPVEGKANAAVTVLLARALKVPRRDVTVVAGAASKRKTVRVEGVTPQAVMELIDAS
jgi:uncharacterized protein (TIGR00251 family)